MEISEVLAYLIKVISIQGAFFVFYWLALRNRSSHALNRYYLLGTLLGSFVIPFISIPVPMVTQPIINSEMFVWIAEPINLEQSGSYNTGASFSIWSLISWVYIGLTVFLIGRSSFYLIILQKLKKRSEYVKKQWFKIFKIAHSRPFSFFSNVFIPRDIFGSDAYDRILAHECEHVRQVHSLDRLLVDFIVALFWFNPFNYLYRRALIEVHEYQADASVVAQFDDLIGYQEILFSQLRSVPYSGLVSHFNFSTIKKRIVMMNKSKAKGQSKIAYFFTVPVVALVLFAFTSKEGEDSVVQIAERIEEIAAPFESTGSFVSVSVDYQEDKYRPSVLPLRDSKKMKVTSSYGWRTDPTDNKRKMHKGIDLGVPIGTEVIATADGEVSLLVSEKGGSGESIVLNHGESFSTKYDHLSSFKVKRGDKVVKGQVIALSGNSGLSMGPHLHYEVIENDVNKNPMDFIKDYNFKIYVKPVKSSSKSRDESNDLIEIEEELVKKEEKLAPISEELAVVEESKYIIELAKIKENEATLTGQEKRVIANKVIVAIEEKAEALKKISELKEIEELEMSRAQAEIKAAEEEKAMLAKELLNELRLKEKELKKIKEKDKKKDKDKNKIN